MDNKQYDEYIKKHAQKTNQWLTLPIAFVVGGIICMIGQGLMDLYKFLLPNLQIVDIATITSMTMIFLGALFTGLGLYDKLGAYAGAGSIVPITGFANSIVSPAMEYSSDGIVLGIMAKMFIVAGPIIVAGICSSVVVGAIYWIIGVFV